MRCRTKVRLIYCERVDSRLLHYLLKHLLVIPAVFKAGIQPSALRVAGFRLEDCRNDGVVPLQEVVF